MLHVFFNTVESNTLTSKAIAWFGKLKTGKADVSHVGLAFDNQFTVEALFSGLRSRNFQELRLDPATRVYRVEGVDEAKIVRAKIESLGRLGKLQSLYGFTKLPLQVGDAVLSFLRKKPTFFFTKLIPSKWFPICSWYVGHELFKTLELSEFKDWRGYSPDDIEDIMEECKETFILEVNEGRLG